MCPKDRCLGSLHYNAVSDKVGWQTDKRPRLLLPFLVKGLVTNYGERGAGGLQNGRGGGGAM